MAERTREGVVSAFTLDTSGCVELPLRTEDGDRLARHFWSDLSPFEQGCLEALIESLGRARRCPVCFGSGTVVRYKRPPMSITCGQCAGHGKVPARFSDLSPEALALIRGDCEGVGPAEPRAFNHEALRRMGAQLWRERQGYPMGWRYSDTKTFYPLTVTCGDDGKIRLTETPSKRASS